MSPYEVCPAETRDAKAIAEIHALALRAAYQGIVPDDQLGALAPATREAKWRQAIEFAEPQVHVAVQGDTVVGFVGFDRSRDPKTKPTDGEIWSLYVHPEHWGKGVALQLWEAAEEGLEDEGCTTVSAWVPLKNERALRFFEHQASFKRDMKTARTSAWGAIRIEEVRVKRTLG